MLPPNGVEVSIPGVRGRVRGLKVENIPDESVAQFRALVDAATGDTLRVPGPVHNGAMVDVWATGCVIANPAGYLTRSTVSGATEASVAFATRYEGGRVRRVEPSGGTLPGVPVVGVELVQSMAKADLNPSASGLTAQEIERRRYALACFEAVRRPGMFRVVAREASGGNLLLVLGGGVLAVGVLLFASIYQNGQDAEYHRQEARDFLAIQSCAQLYEARLAAWRQTGTMPPASEQERACAALVEQRANEGWTALQQDLGDAIKETSKGASKAILIAAGLWGLAQLSK